MSWYKTLFYSEAHARGRKASQFTVCFPICSKQGDLEVLEYNLPTIYLWAFDVTDLLKLLVNYSILKRSSGLFARAWELNDFFFRRLLRAGKMAKTSCSGRQQVLLHLAVFLTPFFTRNGDFPTTEKKGFQVDPKNKFLRHKADKPRTIITNWNRISNSISITAVNKTTTTAELEMNDARFLFQLNKYHDTGRLCREKVPLELFKRNMTRNGNLEYNEGN